VKAAQNDSALCICRPTMQCIGPAGCSRFLLYVKVAPTHRAADCER
jgi:hypothetical protein